MTDHREIFEKFPNGITLHDASDGTILDTNQRFCEMLGYDRAELLELDFAALHPNEPPYTDERAEQYIQKAATEGPQTFEWADKTKDGELLPVEVALRQTAIDGEQRILAVVRDITERKRRENELERKNTQLEEFANVVAHDLRNPLNVAEGRLELAAEECDSEHLDDVASAHDRMAALIEDLLELAREGERIDEIESVDFADLAETCRQQVETVDATVEIEAEGLILADGGRLQELLENLFRNAIEYGGQDVTISVGVLDDGFYVEDDGPGIPENKRDEVFDAGYSTAEDGTGFGLSIVKRVAEAHGWRIQVTEGDEGGARFEIRGIEFAAE